MPSICSAPYWTEWFNTTHPKKNAKGGVLPNSVDGDYELIDDIAALGLNICPKAYISDIECMFIKKIQR